MFENDIDSCEIYLMILTLIAAAAAGCWVLRTSNKLLQLQKLVKYRKKPELFLRGDFG